MSVGARILSFPAASAPLESNVTVLGRVLTEDLMRRAAAAEQTCPIPGPYYWPVPARFFPIEDNEPV